MSTKKDEKEVKKPKRWYRFLWNKYLIVLVLFGVWMFFFDQNSYFIHKELDKEVKTLNRDKKYYQQKLEKETFQIEQMRTNPEEVERIAREKHYLKKENEDVFIVEKRKVKKVETHATH